LSTGLDLRGDELACAVIETRNGAAVLQHAEVVNIADASSLDYPGKVVLVAEPEACFRKRLELHPQAVIPHHRRFASIAAADADRPGGRRQAAAVEIREREVVVALTNLDTLDATRQRLRDIIGVPIGTVDPAAAWFAYFQAQQQTPPEILVDDWSDPAQLIDFEPNSSWVGCEVEGIPKGSIAQRASAIQMIVQGGVLSRRAVHHLAVFGRMAESMDDLIARLGGLISNITPLALDRWALAVGAATVGAHFFPEQYEEIAS